MTNKSKHNPAISFFSVILIAIALIFLANTVKAQNLPNYDQVMKDLPAPVSNFTNTVKRTIDSAQTPSAQNIDTKSLINEISAAFNWLGAQFQDLTGVGFNSLVSTVVNFLIWLVKLVIGIVAGIINLIGSFSKK